MTATDEAIDVPTDNATTTVDPHAGPDQIGAPSSTAALAPLPAMTPANLTAPIATVEAARQAFEAYNTLRHTLITKDDVQNIQGKEFVTKSGWRKMAVVMGVSSEIVARDYQRDFQGRIISAEVVVRATAPNGRYIDGLGLCDFHERCCPRAWNEDAVCKQGGRHTHCATGCDGFNHFSKPQHDIPATASTRALNRACSDLFGFGEVSAEEVTDEPASPEFIAALVHGLNELTTENGTRTLTKQAFARQFGLPHELKNGQIEAVRRFANANGVTITDAPAPAGESGDRTPPAESTADAVAPKPDTEADSSAGGEGDGSASEGDGPGSAVGSSPSQGPSPSNEGARPSTTVQRRNIGIRWKDLVAKGLVTDADKKEYVAIVTGERVRSTTDATFDEAVKLLAGIQLLSQESISMVDDPEVPGARTLSTMPDSTLGPKFLASLPSGVRA